MNAEASGTSSERGRNAAHPGDIPARGWKDVLVRVRRRAVRDQLSITAAGVAFYALLATFPGLLVLLAIYGVVFDPAQMTEQMQFLKGQLHPQAMQLLGSVLRSLGESDRANRFGVAGSALITFWGASLGVRALIRALNLAYGEEEKRSLLARHGMALLLTAGAISVAFCVGLALVGLPVLTHWFRLEPGFERLVYYGRWPVVALMFWLSLLVFYRYGPSRSRARWSWVSWGALIATALWLFGSGVLAWYVAGSEAYHQAYGSAGLVVLVLAWFLVSAYVVLLGAEINAELERQTGRDTTVGRERPQGERGARAADSLGESAS